MHHGTCFVACLVLTCSLALADEPKTAHEFARDVQWVLNTHVARHPLAEDDLERWATILHASEAQIHAMKREYASFVSHHNRFMEREMPDHVDRGAELGIMQRERLSNTAEFARKQSEMDRHNARIRTRLIAIEHDLIDSFRPFLAEHQIRRLGVLYDDATRRNCRTFVTPMRWSRIELRPLWNQSVARDVSPLKAELIDAILAEYESRLTILVCRQLDLLFHTRYRLTRNRMAREQGDVTPEEGHQRYLRLMWEWYRAGRAVRELQHQTIDWINDLLREPLATVFQDAVKQVVFPEIYPDAHALHDLFAALADDHSLAEDAKLALALLNETYAKEYQLICEELEDVCITWGDKSAQGIMGYEHQFLSDALQPVLAGRSELSREMLAKLREMIGSDTLKRHRGVEPAQLEVQKPTVP